MVFLKFITIYAFCALMTHFALFRFARYKESIPALYKEVLFGAPAYAQWLVVVVITPFFVISFILFIIRKLRPPFGVILWKVRNWQLRKLILCCDQWKWYEKKIFKRRMVFWLSIIVFGPYNVVNFMNEYAANKVADILIDVIIKLCDERKDIDTISHQGEAK